VGRGSTLLEAGGRGPGRNQKASSAPRAITTSSVNTTRRRDGLPGGGVGPFASVTNGAP